MTGEVELAQTPFEGLEHVILVEERFKDVPPPRGYDSWGHRALFRFPNGWGLSVISGFATYGLEAATIAWINDDIDGYELVEMPGSEEYEVIWGYLNRERLQDLIQQVLKLEPFQPGIDYRQQRGLEA